MTGRSLGTSWLVAAAAMATVGCGPKPEFAAVEAPPPPPPATVAEPEPPPPAPTVTDCDSVQSLAMSTMFQGRAPSEAPRMQPEGAAVCGVVPEGQSISGPTMILQPGSCYTVLAQALPTVTEVDVQLELDLTGGGVGLPALAALNLKPMLAVDSDTGPTGAIGAKQSCYQWPFPIPASVKVTVKARTGSGPVAAQLFSRKK